MLVTEIYNGQGLGNQLACYVTTRVVALDKGFDFGIMNSYKFKCLDFMNLDFGKTVVGGSGPEGGPPNILPEGIKYYFRERGVYIPTLPNPSDIRIDDPLLELIEDNTKLDGVFQSENRIIHRKDEIVKWLKVKDEYDCYDYSSEDICIINFRGGDYSSIPGFYLNNSYWRDSIFRMRNINPDFRFVVITDDVNRAKGFFPNFEVYHFGIGKDYSIIKNAYYLILSNSSFPYFAVLSNDRFRYILAPKYWGRYNISDGYWHCGYNIFRNHNYIDRYNNIFSYDECIKEFEEYKLKNKKLWE